MNLIPKAGLTYLEKVTITHLGTTEFSIGDSEITLTPRCEDDRARLEAVFPANFSGTVVGKWKSPIEFVIGDCLTFRSQAGSDQSKIELSCPRDQQASYCVAWEGDCLKLVSVDDVATKPTSEQVAFNRINALPDAELETLAAEVGVEWDTKASRKTMVEKVVAKRTEMTTKPPVKEPVKTKGK